MANFTAQNPERYFEAMKAQVKKNAAKREANQSGGGDFVKYLQTGFDKTDNKNKLVRFTSPIIKIDPIEDNISVDGKVIGTFDDYDARTGITAEIYDDSGRMFFPNIPEMKHDPNHIYWKIWKLIMKRHKGVDKDATDDEKYVYKKTHPEVFDRVRSNGKNIGISKRMYDEGWKQIKIVQANVIDRELMDLHREHKHTFLLSRHMSPFGDDMWYDKGMKVWKFVEDLEKLISYYGPLFSFDIFIERTGKSEDPFPVTHAFKHKEEVPEYLHEYISEARDLTDEEKSWEQYNIKDIMKPTSMFIWFDRLQEFIKKVDVTFGTRLYEETQERAEKERAENEERKKEQEVKVTSQGTDVSSEKRSEPPVRRRSTSSTSESNLKGVEGVEWGDMTAIGCTEEGKKYFTDEVKNLMKSVDKDAKKVSWNSSAQEYACVDETCDFLSPEIDEIKGCLKCGAEF